jgi:tetratricopeptide (TPR) repeat protein
LVNRGKATPRHQTLQAVLQWSYDHLSPDEQRLFGLCSVFVGGWTLDAALVVCNPEIDEASLVDLLDGLVKKSLVSVDRGRSTGPRYRMLEIVRQFSHDQQLQSVEADSVRHRHLAYYLALAESIDQSYSGQTNDYFFPRLDQERENIVAAHAWCSHGDNGGELGLRLVNAMRGYWVERKYLLSLPIAEHDPVVEGHRLIVEALRHHGARARTAHRCRALFAASQMSYLLRKFEQANSYLDESLAIARELNDTERMSARLRVRSYYFRLNGDVLRARQCIDEGLALAEQHGPPSELAMNLSAMGNLMLAEKRISDAEQCFVRALELGRKVGRPALIASIAVELCVTALQRHDTATALRMLRDAHPIVERLNEWEAAIQLLEACAALAVHRGDWVRAARFFGATKERIADMILDDPGMVTFIAELLARSEQALGAERFAAEVSVGSGMSYQDAIRETGDWLMQQRD